MARSMLALRAGMESLALRQRVAVARSVDITECVIPYNYGQFVSSVWNQLFDSIEQLLSS